MIKPICFAAILVGLLVPQAGGENLTLENDTFRVVVDSASGAITSLFVKELQTEMIGEGRLAANFRINLPLPDYNSHYIDGMQQKPASVKQSGAAIEARFDGMRTEKGDFPLDLGYTITLDGEALKFHARLTNRSAAPVAEFWFPRLGGWTDFSGNRAGLVATPNYIGCQHSAPLFNGFPGGRGLGAEAAEWSGSYPGMVMPWWDLYDAKTNRGLYLGYHDPTFRLSTWHCYLYPNASGHPDISWMTPEEAAGAPIGLVFSHVRYPYIKNGETFDSGEFIIRYHRGDWHEGSQYYRQWFMEHFPFDKSKSWLRQKSAWFTAILYQPEDKVVADFNTYDQWCKDAADAGIHCFEMIGWSKGGIERDYPAYVPEERLGGRDGFRALMKSINARGDKCLAFANYNVMDCNTDWYKNELKPYTHQDTFGNTPNWMAWGEGTLTARTGLSVRRHLLASAVPGFQKVLEDEFVQAAKDGANGLQLDKVVAGSALDFNPLNTLKPDEALCEGLVRGIAGILEKCRAVNPEFCIASEACQDRLIPYVDVYYRNAGGFDIAPLRYVFPEWTACQHVAGPNEFNGVNSAVLTGAVICVEPDSYQTTLGAPQFKKLGEYIRETERIRAELRDTIFLGKYHDKLGAAVQEVTPSAADPKQYDIANSGQVLYRVHSHRETGQRAIVVANISRTERRYYWDFLEGKVDTADVYEPFAPVRTVRAGEPLSIPGERFQVLIEHREAQPGNVRLSMRCGIPPQEITHADAGYDATVLEGFSCAWFGQWKPPVYHCRADEKAIRIEVRVPKNGAGTLRLYAFDADQMGGGRKEEIFLNGQSQGVIEGFSQGRWLEYPMSPAMTGDGKVAIEVVNRKEGSNAVLSLIEWRE